MLSANREYLVPHIRNINGRFHSEANYNPRSDDRLQPITLHHLKAQSLRVPVFMAICFCRVSSEKVPAKGLKIFPIHV